MTSVLFNTREYYQPNSHVDGIINSLFMASLVFNTLDYYQPTTI